MKANVYPHRTVLVTGATGAIGEAIARILAERDYSLILACRNPEKGKILAEELKEAGSGRVSFIPLDLLKKESVENAAKMLAAFQIDGIINNAGMMTSTFHTSPEGHEDTLTVNYHNTKLLTELLIPQLKHSANITFTTSATRRWYPFQCAAEDIDRRHFSRLRAYALSKKLITLYALELSERLKPRGILVNGSDPGVVDSPMLRMGHWYDRLTDLFFRPFCLSPKQGAEAALRALDSFETGKIYLAPFGRLSMPRKLFYR